MTEAEWLTCNDPTQMVDWLTRYTIRPSERKWRLLFAGCARQVWHQIPAGPKREAVEIAERYVEGGATSDELRATGLAYYVIDEWVKTNGKIGFQAHALAYAAAASERFFSRPHLSTRWPALSALVGRFFPDLLRCVVGPLPFRPVTFSPSWGTPVVTAQAHDIYTDRAFDRLPILADAIQDAGCDDADILGHCRGDGPHVRGCWVVDGVLGKG